MKRILAAALLCGVFVPSYAQKIQEQKFECIADTWFRTDKETNHGEDGKIEIQDPSEETNFYGVFAFNVTVPKNYKVLKATLRLVAERRKGSHNTLQAFSYPNDFEESTTYSHEQEYVENLPEEPLSEFEMAGTGYSLPADEIKNENYQSVDGWTNLIDVTAGVPATKSGRVNFLLTAKDVEAEQKCYFTREASAIENTKNAGVTISIPAEDLVPLLIIEFVEDTNLVNLTLDPLADTQVRKGNTTNYGGNGELEIKTTSGGDEFYALMSFQIPADAMSDDYTISEANLRIVTFQCKGDRGMSIYHYENAFDESTTFENEEEYIRAALEKDPIATYSANGFGNRNMTESKVTEDYNDVKAWTNYIDLKDYLVDLKNQQKETPATRSAVPVNAHILIAKTNTHTDAMKIFSKEAVDKENTTLGVTFKKEDLVPQLSLVYTKNNTQSAVSEIADDENSPVEYFNLQGMKVSGDLTPGIYVRRQGSKASKVIIK